MKKKIQTVLHSVGIFQHYYGYNYFQDAVFLALEKPERLQSIRKEIYFPVAKKHRTTITSVEKNLRTVRDALIKNGGLETLENLTGCPLPCGKKLYPKDLICIFADYLSND
ncbi:MAG: hypothetical protein HFI26_11265 [Lachnospiraceae bacterium]|jgi:hypothetical protein|nr:hypothetical protein [Lachnospiraceae bacterium]MCI9681951.1 hypothetical protein [Lachnospiraceae bacterium]